MLHEGDVILVFGIVQYGLHFHRQQGYHAAAREGARVASIPNTTKPEIILHTESALTGVLGDDPTITVTPDIDVPCDRRRGELVQVDITVPATIEIPLVGTKNYTLTGHGEFRCE